MPTVSSAWGTCDPALKLPTETHTPRIQLPLATDFPAREALKTVLQNVLVNKFIPALGLLARVVMGLGYQRIVACYGYCPRITATGGLRRGKMTSLVTVLSTIASQRIGIYVLYRIAEKKSLRYVAHLVLDIHTAGSSALLRSHPEITSV